MVTLTRVFIIQRNLNIIFLVLHKSVYIYVSHFKRSVILFYQLLWILSIEWWKTKYSKKEFRYSIAGTSLRWLPTPVCNPCSRLFYPIVANDTRNLEVLYEYHFCRSLYLIRSIITNTGLREGLWCRRFLLLYTLRSGGEFEILPHIRSQQCICR
jgi:hypothetical protein